MTEAEEIALLRADVAALKATALTAEQRAAVDRLAEHVEALVGLVEADKFTRRLWSTVRSWSAVLAALMAGMWVIKDSLARAVRALLEP